MSFVDPRVTSDTNLVRLKSPFYAPGRGYWPRGVHAVADIGDVLYPSTAEILKGAAAKAVRDEANSTEDSETPLTLDEAAKYVAGVG